MKRVAADSQEVRKLCDQLLRPLTKRELAHPQVHHRPSGCSVASTQSLKLLSESSDHTYFFFFFTASSFPPCVPVPSLSCPAKSLGGVQFRGQYPVAAQ